LLNSCPLEGLRADGSKIIESRLPQHLREFAKHHCENHRRAISAQKVALATQENRVRMGRGQLGKKSILSLLTYNGSIYLAIAVQLEPPDDIARLFLRRPAQ
jgi:hypothetical protein